ncbi:MAG TPA: aminotransferase class V-fold PLP-dependent enzyme, partial [Polyangiaceae bacterium]
NPYVGYWYAAPGCAQIEHTVIRWFCDLIGLPDPSGGVLTSGGSMANLIALVTARILRLGDDFTQGTIYASDQLHHSIRKALLFAGFPAARLRIVPSDASCRMQPQALALAMARDRAAGLRPFFVVATAGTTNTGAVDDMQTIAEIAVQHEAWFHVDAAYGGFFALTERGRTRLRGIERADSVVLDPHKSLFLPFGTGCLLVRRLDDLRQAHLVHSDYLQTVVKLGQDAGATNLADLSPELSRDFRGLRVWLPMKLLGAAAFRRSLDEKLDLTEWALGRLRAMDGVEILTEPELSILAFRVTLPQRSTTELDEMNERILARINRKGRVHLSATTVRGRFALRICILSFRVHRDTVMACLEDLREGIDAESER